MTHIDIARTRKSLRKHWAHIHTHVLDIEHFRVPACKPKYVNGKLAYLPRTHIACVVTNDHDVFVGVSRPHPSYDTYNAKVGLEIAFGRALFALRMARTSHQGIHPWKVQFIRSNNWAEFTLDDSTLNGYKLRDACRAQVEHLGILSREEGYEWNKLTKQSVARLQVASPADSTSKQPPQKPPPPSLPRSRSVAKAKPRVK